MTSASISSRIDSSSGLRAASLAAARAAMPGFSARTRSSSVSFVTPLSVARDVMVEVVAFIGMLPRCL